MATRIILVRHAVTDANVSDKFLGKTDISLSKLGFAQAKVLGERIADEFKIDAIYSSNMKRTLQTARAIAFHQRVPLHRSKKLVELNFGDWEGRTHGEVAFKYPYEFLQWQKKNFLPKHLNCETVDELKSRLVRAVKDIIRKHDGETVCLVTHGACIKVLLSYFEGITLDNLYSVPWCDNTGITVVDINDETYSIKVKCDTRHLRPELAPVTYGNIGRLIESARRRVKPKHRYEFFGS